MAKFHLIEHGHLTNPTSPKKLKTEIEKGTLLKWKWSNRSRVKCDMSWTATENEKRKKDILKRTK